MKKIYLLTYAQTTNVKATIQANPDVDFTDLPDKKLYTVLKHLLLNKVLTENFFTTTKQIKYYKMPYNYYFLSKFYISISNKPGLIVIAVSTKPVGIDCEFFKNRDFSVLLRGFSENIRKVFLTQSNKVEYFFKLWTTAEAYFKMEGMPLPIHEIDTKVSFPMVKSYWFAKPQAGCISVAQKSLEIPQFFLVSMDKKHTLSTQKTRLNKL